MIRNSRQRARLVGLATLLVWSTGPVWADTGCAECHREIWLMQSGTPHARALSRFEGSVVAAVLLAEGHREDAGYSYEYAGNTVTVSNADSFATATLVWAFGAGVQGMTPVGFLNGSYFEYRFSWYRSLNQPATSPGHVPRIPSMYFALGTFESPADAARCFNCHATGVIQDESGGLDLSKITPGVTCERCHGPGTDHVAAIRGGRPAAEIRHAIFNSGRLPPKASIEVCGGCHRTPPPGYVPREPEKDTPVSVRFQPVGLLASKCFQRSGRLSCLSCHDPHGDAVRSAQYYTKKCLECHAPVRGDVDSAHTARPSTTCRRNQMQDCLPCHMRPTRPLENLAFTDHRIRIY